MNPSNIEKILQKSVLTTKDAASLIGVSLPSIINWADAGQFASFRTPGGHRRIKTKDFVAFAKRKGYPLLTNVTLHTPTLLQSSVIILDQNLDYATTIQEFLQVHSEVSVFTCSHLLCAGILIGKEEPKVLVVDQESTHLPDDFFEQLQKIFPSLNLKVLILGVQLQNSDLHNRFIYIDKGRSIRQIVQSIMELLAL